MNPIITLYSNRIEVLLSQLVEKLKFSLSNDPFKKRLIVTPGPWVKTWLMEKLAQEPELGTTLGLTLLTVEEAIPFLRRELLAPSPKRIPSLLELTCLLEGELSTIEDPEIRIWLGTQAKKKKYLAEKTAHLFQKYGRFAPGCLSGWQKELWQKIYAEESPWTFPYQVLSEEKKPSLYPLEIDAFALTFLSTLEFNFLKSAATHGQVNYWILTPCLHFWSDLATDREKKWHLKHAPAQQALALDELLSDTNPLLANFGKMGREMAKLIEAEETEHQNAFLVSREVCLKGDYVDFEGAAFLTEEPATRLRYLQADLLFLRNPKITAPLSVEETDRSLEIHFLPNEVRETEWVLDLVLRLLKEGKRDVLIMAPDIEIYVPYIKHFFSQLPYTLSGRSLLEEEPLISLLDMYLGEIELIPSLLEAGGFDNEERAQIEKWTQNYDLHDQGLSNLIEKTLTEKIEISQLELIDKLIIFLNSLKDAKPKPSATLSAFADWLESLPLALEAELLATIKRMGERIKKPLSYLLFVELVKKTLQNDRERKAEHNLGQIRFASLAPMRAQPGEALILMGLSDGALPRPDSKNSLDLTLDFTPSDWAPSKGDFDRTLFLECLLSAREHLFITWSGTEKPALLVEELTHYLKMAFTDWPGMLSHPRFAHNPAYYTADSKYPSLNQDAYKAALVEPVSSTPLNNKKIPLENEKNFGLINLDDLKKLLKDPYKYYRKENGIHTTNDSEYKQEEAWELSGLEKWKVRNQYLLNTPAKQPVKGLFNKLRFRAAETEKAKLAEFFESIAHSPQSPIKISPTGKIPLYGLVSHGTKSGLLVNGEMGTEYLLRALPELLLLMKEDAKKDTLHFIKDRKSKKIKVDDPSRQLMHLLNYATRAKKNFYPFYPDLVKPIMEGDEKKINEGIKEHKLTMTADYIIENYQQEALELFGEIKELL